MLENEFMKIFVAAKPNAKRESVRHTGENRFAVAVKNNSSLLASL